MWLMGIGIVLQFFGFAPKFYAMLYKLNSVGLEGDPVQKDFDLSLGKKWFGVTKE